MKKKTHPLFSSQMRTHPIQSRAFIQAAVYQTTQRDEGKERAFSFTIKSNDIDEAI